MRPSRWMTAVVQGFPMSSAPSPWLLLLLPLLLLLLLHPLAAGLDLAPALFLWQRSCARGTAARIGGQKRINSIRDAGQRGAQPQQEHHQEPQREPLLMLMPLGSCLPGGTRHPRSLLPMARSGRSTQTPPAASGRPEQQQQQQVSDAWLIEDGVA